MRAMVLAAGAGTRLRPLTYQVPKPMVPVVNRPVVHHVLDNLAKHGVKDVMLNLYAQGEQIKTYCGNGSKWDLRLKYSEESKLLGTAGAVKKVAGFFKKGGPFFVLSGDGLSDIDLSEMLAFHKSRKSLATMAVKAVDSRMPYGVTLTGSAGRITGFMEKPSWADVFSNRVNTGIYLFEPEVLDLIPARRFYDFGHELWPKLLKLRKPIFAYDTPAYWCDVGNLTEYRKCQVDCMDGKVGIEIPGNHHPRRKGIWIEPGSTISPQAVLEAPCVIGSRCVIADHAVIGPYTVIGAGAYILPSAVLKNCILFDNVTVGENVHLSNCILGTGGNVTENISVYEAAVINVRQ